VTGWRDYQQNLDPTPPPAGTQHYGGDATAEIEFTPRKNSSVWSAAFAGLCLGVLVASAAAWLLVVRSCDTTTCASMWVL
jgi:hypothetical protein